MSETMLKIDNLVVDYGHVHAIRDISLEVDRNEIVCLTAQVEDFNMTPVGIYDWPSIRVRAD